MKLLSPKAQYRLRMVVCIIWAAHTGRELGQQALALAKWACEPLKPKYEPFLLPVTAPAPESDCGQFLYGGGIQIRCTLPFDHLGPCVNYPFQGPDVEGDGAAEDVDDQAVTE